VIHSKTGVFVVNTANYTHYGCKT